MSTKKLETHAEQLGAIKRDVELRKWAADQAVSLGAAALEAEHGMIEVVVLARSIHAFLVEGATETKT